MANLANSAVYLTVFFFLLSPLESTFLHRIPPANATPIMRAWTCHGRTHKELIEKLTSAQIVTSKAVRDCLLRVDRANYVLNKEVAYDDTPQPIGYGQTISAPHMHAHVLEELLPTLTQVQNQDPSVNLSILDVGCGSGYLTACLGRLVDKANPLGFHGKVWGIDVVPELVDLTKTNMKKADNDLLESGVVDINLGDGWKGLPSHAPFHIIHVGAAAETFPKNLMMQLALGGTMVVPVGPVNSHQYLYRVDRLKVSTNFQESDYTIKQLLGVRYVPLVRPN
eukprot:CAMPEP_0172481066 /NCGR_PEP_ID=MMETSP1066-20121228/6617_1 /TAXON_ID=671091 /ORGANISM="Coscinodiscus wailesii, Strain CCMP2513" /LENGTH=280 /DNA_ID=CAMNT_0013242977 /DNA_START=29 /DNA_END=871 /DNA_ORIENTATION=+